MPTVGPTFPSKDAPLTEEVGLQSLFYLEAKYFWEQTYKKAWSHVKDIL